MANQTAVKSEKPAKKEKIKKTSSFLTVLQQLSYNKLAMFGLILFLTMLLLCALAPIIAPYGYNDLDIINQNQFPSAEHLFGTDNLGRDIFSRILYGGRYSLTMGIFSVLFSMAAGIVIGSVAGYFGGWVDNIIMRVLDVIQSLPGMLLTIVLSAVLGAGYFNTVLCLSVGSIPGQARMLRAQMLKIRNNEYIEASQSINCSKARIMFIHMLPNSFSPLIVGASMGIAGAITMAAGLSFMGLGVQPPAPEWGAILSASRQYMRDFPYMVIAPGACIALAVLALNLLGDGLRDALDPRLKR